MIRRAGAIGVNSVAPAAFGTFPPTGRHGVAACLLRSERRRRGAIARGRQMAKPKWQNPKWQNSEAIES
jgi:hypothetical protein